MIPPVVLTIGGSDSGGGAGIQADLKTFLAFQVHGCSAITCVTAQNTCGVSRVDPLPPAALTAQIAAVTTDLSVAAVKTGMLLNRHLIEATAAAFDPLAIPRLIDPVMVSRAGSLLLDPEAIDAYRHLLLPMAELLTPNLHEACLLSGITLQDVSDVERAAERLLALGPRAVLIKGGGLPHLRGSDYYLPQTGSGQWLSHPPVATLHTHGSGCTLSAAITALRAKGIPLVNAISAAKAFVHHGLCHSLAIGEGQGPLCHWHPMFSSHG